MQSQVPLTSAGWLQEILTWAGSTPADCTPCEWVSASGSTRSNSDEPSCGLSSSGSHILWIGSLKKDTPLNFRTSSSYTGLRFHTKLHTHCQRLQFELQVNMLQKELSIALNKHLNSCRPAPRLTHPLCCSLRAIMQKTPPPSVSILHSHAERLKPARHSGGHQSGPPSDSQSRNLHIATSTSQSADLLKACPRCTTMFGTLVSQRLSPNLAHLYNFSV